MIRNNQDQICPKHGCIVPSSFSKRKNLEYWVCNFAKSHFLDHPDKVYDDFDLCDIDRGDYSDDGDGYNPEESMSKLEAQYDEKNGH